MNSTRWSLDYSTFYHPEKGDTIKLKRYGKCIAYFSDTNVASSVLQILLSVDRLEPGLLHFLRHRWEALGVHYAEMVFYFRGVQLPDHSALTDVLLKCAICGDVKTKELNGTWTLEQLRASPPVPPKPGDLT